MGFCVYLAVLFVGDFGGVFVDVALPVYVGDGEEAGGDVGVVC